MTGGPLSAIGLRLAARSGSAPCSGLRSGGSNDPRMEPNRHAKPARAVGQRAFNRRDRSPRRRDNECRGRKGARVELSARSSPIRPANQMLPHSSRRRDRPPTHGKLGLKVGWRSTRLYIQTPRCRLLKKTSYALTARSWRNRNTLPIIQMVGANWVVFVPGSRLGPRMRSCRRPV
jgi:hypothetical protein